jgi:hypothetical protein
MNNNAQNNFSIVLPLPDLIRAIIVALRALGIEISPDIDNSGKSIIPFLFTSPLNYSEFARIVATQLESANAAGTAGSGLSASGYDSGSGKFS